MEAVFSYAILLSPLLLVVALLQRRWSRRRAIAYVGLFAAVLTAVFGWVDWGGFVDDRITQGIVTMYGWTVAGLALAASAIMFMLNPPRPADEAERG